jgi:hypothetical protein
MLDNIIANTLDTGADLHYNYRLLLPDGSLKYIVGIGERKFK